MIFTRMREALCAHPGRLVLMTNSPSRAHDFLPLRLSFYIFLDTFFYHLSVRDAKVNDM